MVYKTYIIVSSSLVVGNEHLQSNKIKNGKMNFPALSSLWTLMNFLSGWGIIWISYNFISNIKSGKNV